MNGEVEVLVKRYTDLNFRLIYWPRHGSDPKDWKGPREASWNDPTKSYPLDKYDPETMNLGVITGHEIAPGKYLTDIDLDWAGGLQLAARLLPASQFGFGRKGKKVSHVFYTTSEPLDLMVYDDVADDGNGNGERFVELRCGISSSQTMIAPSLHSPGIQIENVLAGPIGHAEPQALKNGVLDYAIGCLLLKRCPGGLHHDGRKALAGYLLRAKFDPERVIQIGEEVCRIQAASGVPDMSSKDVSDMTTVVKSTMKRFEAGKPYEGGPSLADFIGGVIGKAVLTRLNKWLGREDDFIRDQKGGIIKDHQENIGRAIDLLGHKLAYNSFSDQLLIDNVPLDDRMMNDIWLRIDTEFRFRPTFQFFEKVVAKIAWDAPFHPVRQYLDKLTWDGTPRIDRWLVEYGGAEDTPFVRAVSSIVLMAAVRRIREPGCKYDEMLILEGEQGLNKSSAIRALCPDDTWFSDDLPLNVESQRVIEATLGKWIVEAADLAGKRRADVEQLKSTLSRAADRARLAYARISTERRRQFIIIGTTNSAVYLMDPTGGRRFWPVAIKKFNIEALITVRDQLWAEASHRERQGESIRLKEALWPAAAKQQEKRRLLDPWEHKIIDWIKREVEFEVDEEIPEDDVRFYMRQVKLANTDVWKELGIDESRVGRYEQQRICEVMAKIGLKSQTVWVPAADGVGGKAVRGFAGNVAEHCREWRLECRRSKDRQRLEESQRTKLREVLRTREGV